MAFNRGLYSQGTSMNSIKKTKETAEKFAKNFYSDSGRVGYHRIEEGVNTFRVAFAHDPKDTPYAALRYCRIEMEVDEYDDHNQKTGNKTWAHRKYFVATQHGPVDASGKPIFNSDPVELYIETLTAKLKSEGLKDDEIKKRMSPVFGYWDSNNWKSGIRPDSKMICYAWNQNGELKFLELNRRWFEDMEKISVEASRSGEAFDIFSHIDNGCPLKITKTKLVEQGKRGKTEYKVSKEEPDMISRESWESLFERTRVTDDQIKQLLATPSLKEQYKENYKKQDYYNVLHALQRFDRNNGFGIFNEIEYKQKLKDIEAKLSFIKEEETASESKPVATASPIISDTGVIDSHEMTTPKKRRFIQKYVKENYEGKVLPALSKNDVDVWFSLAASGEDLPFETQFDDLPFDAGQGDDEMSNRINALKNE